MTTVGSDSFLYLNVFYFSIEDFILRADVRAKKVYKKLSDKKGGSYKRKKRKTLIL